jgi:hypothetical protein
VGPTVKSHIRSPPRTPPVRPQPRTRAICRLLPGGLGMATRGGIRTQRGATVARCSRDSEWIRGRGRSFRERQAHDGYPTVVATASEARFQRIYAAFDHGVAGGSPGIPGRVPPPKQRRISPIMRPSGRAPGAAVKPTEAAPSSAPRSAHTYSGLALSGSLRLDPTRARDTRRRRRPTPWGMTRNP